MEYLDNIEAYHYFPLAIAKASQMDKGGFCYLIQGVGNISKRLKFKEWIG